MINVPKVTNIVGNTPSGSSILIQSVQGRNAILLKNELSNYVIRSLDALSDTSDIQSWQKIFNTQAIKVPELQARNNNTSLVYDFEHNQRVGELLALLAMSATINTVNENREVVLLPAWQRPKQDAAMQEFYGKYSWDGFMFDQSLYSSKEKAPSAVLFPVEIKSLMIDPKRDNFESLNDLLDAKMTDFSRHFQKEGSICAVTIFPYVFNATQVEILFDLENAVSTFNKYVTSKAIGYLVFFETKSNNNGTTKLSVKCHIVSKNPIVANTENTLLYEMVIGNYIQTK